MTTQINNPHGGDPMAIAATLGLDHTEVQLDFSVNINPLGPPDCVRYILAAGRGIQAYPDIYADKAASALANMHSVNDETILVGNGSTEIISWILQALKPSRPVWFSPCYSGYKEVCNALSINGRGIQASGADFSILLNHVANSGADLIFLASPNNPTGSVIDPKDIISLAQNIPDMWIVFDESFIDFTEDSASRTLIRKNLPRNIIVLKSLTKFFAIPGLRLGMAYAHPHVAAIVKQSRLPWSVNSLAQQIAMCLYKDRQYIDRSRSAVKKLREYLTGRLNELPGWIITPSHANFLLARLPDCLTASTLQARLLKCGILIRSCANFSGLDEHYIRLAIRPANETDQLIDAITLQPSIINHKKSRIMLVGTTSDAGKTVLAAGLCRHYQRKGIKVAPFKAQNMALNSFVTADGGEMGRAQVVQAKACCIQPDTDMNPVLLKPMGDAGSQVIVNGHPIGNFPAKEYYKMKQQMKKAAHSAFDRLSAKYEMIILEGAGSPTEINLMEEDFVNMAMAEYANADVLLVADIDRGGVFASIYGTIQLLPDKYRRLIKGIIINKFRGDESLLDSGITQIEELTGVPVLGVLPYIPNLNIEDEDSLGLENRRTNSNTIIDIAVIRLPRISNYTDFLTLEHTSGVSVRYVNQPQDIGHPDLVIIPGTKNTRADLRFIEDKGIADVIMTLARENVPIFGICGGYQMLGCRISDPSGVEGEPGEEIGLNLLPVNTVLEKRKELSQVEGFVEQPLPFVKPHTPFTGYEIHSGRTSSSVHIKQPLLITRRLNDNTIEAAGCASANGLIFGCYVHGLFDSQPLREQLLNWLCINKNVQPPAWQIDDINNFDKLADLMALHINLP